MKTINYKTGVINDPFGQPTVHSPDQQGRSVLFWSILKIICVRTYGQKDSQHV